MHILQLDRNVKEAIDYPRLHNQLRPNFTESEDTFLPVNNFLIIVNIEFFFRNIWSYLNYEDRRLVIRMEEAWCQPSSSSLMDLRFMQTAILGKAGKASRLGIRNKYLLTDFRVVDQTLFTRCNISLFICCVLTNSIKLTDYYWNVRWQPHYVLANLIRKGNNLFSPHYSLFWIGTCGILLFSPVTRLCPLLIRKGMVIN
jgi:hypothetical protein